MTPPNRNIHAVARGIALLAIAVGAGGLAGCGGAQDSADRVAQDKVGEAETALAQKQFATAERASDEAGKTEGISPAMAYKANMLRGRARMAASEQLLGQAQDMELNVSRLLGQVRVASVQATLAQAQIKSDQGYDPAEIIEQLQATVAQAQGGPGAADWRPPTLPAYTPPPLPVAEAPVVPTTPAEATPPATPPATAGANPTPSRAPVGSMARFFSGFLGGGKPAASGSPASVPPAAAVAAAPATAATAPVATAPVATAAPIHAPPLALKPVESKPLEILSLHSLAGLDADIARLQAAISANRSQAQVLSGQRTGLVSQADDLQQKSIGETGQASVDDVAAGAEVRRKAADLAVEIDKLDAAHVHLKADLDKSQIQRAGVADAIDGFNKQIADLQLVWKDVQQDIEAQKQAIAAIAGPAAPGSAAAAPAAAQDLDLPAPPASALTIADQCSQLKGLVLEVRDLRDKAAEEMKEAITDFQTAKAAGEHVRLDALPAIQSDRTPPAEKTALQQLEETYSSGAAALALASAQRELAVDYAAEAMIARQLKWTLTAAQTALGSDAPSAIADCLTATASPSLDDYFDKSRERFEEALAGFDTSSTTQTLSGPAANARKTTAMVGKMITAFGARQLSLATQNKAVGGQTPKELQQTIDDLAKNVYDVDPTMLPAIPYSIAAATPTPQ